VKLVLDVDHTQTQLKKSDGREAGLWHHKGRRQAKRVRSKLIKFSKDGIKAASWDSKRSSVYVEKIQRQTNQGINYEARALEQVTNLEKIAYLT